MQSSVRLPAAPGANPALHKISTSSSTYRPVRQLRFVRPFPHRIFTRVKPPPRKLLCATDQFNVIHPASGNKIDFMIAGATPWSLAQLQRRKRIAISADHDAAFAAPEDVILGKLLYYAEGGSEKHLRDITGILKISGDSVDRQYISHFASDLGVLDIWDAVVTRVG